MKIAFLIYHDVFEDKVTVLLKELGIETYFEWENVVGKFKGADGHFGNRTYPGHDTIRLIPFTEMDMLENLISHLKVFNENISKKSDEIRLYLMPLEKIV